MQYFATSRLTAAVALAAGAAAVAAFGASTAVAAGSTTTHSTHSTRPGHPGESAHADASSSVSNAPYAGKVTAKAPLNIRAQADSSSAVTGSYAPGTVIQLQCKKNGTNVDGNPRWYKLYHHAGWVAARYVENNGAVPSSC